MLFVAVVVSTRKIWRSCYGVDRVGCRMLLGVERSTAKMLDGMSGSSVYDLWLLLYLLNGAKMR